MLRPLGTQPRPITNVNVPLVCVSCFLLRPLHPSVGAAQRGGDWPYRRARSAGSCHQDGVLARRVRSCPQAQGGWQMGGGDAPASAGKPGRSEHCGSGIARRNVHRRAARQDDVAQRVGEAGNGLGGDQAGQRRAARRSESHSEGCGRAAAFRFRVGRTLLASRGARRAESATSNHVRRATARFQCMCTGCGAICAIKSAAVRRAGRRSTTCFISG